MDLLTTVNDLAYIGCVPVCELVPDFPFLMATA